MSWIPRTIREILTTKGDLAVYGTDVDRLPVGTDDQVLTADSAQSLGVKWADAAAAVSSIDDLTDVDTTTTTPTTGDVLEWNGSNWVPAVVSGGSGEILISDTPSTPLVFADLLQNEAQDDLVYSD